MNNKECIKGIGVCRGIGIGKAVILKEYSLDYEKITVLPENREKELVRLNSAIETFVTKTQELKDKLSQTAGSHESEILEGQLSMIADPMVLDDMKNNVVSGKCCEEAVELVCDMFIAMFEGIDDETMRQRSTDIKDMKVRILKILLGINEIDVSNCPKGSVVFAKELTPSITAGFKKENISGIVTENGGRTSHIAILAKAMNIPAVLGVKDIVDKVADGEDVVVSGTDGFVCINPDEEQLENFRQEAKKWYLEQAENEKYKSVRLSKDGHSIMVYGNIGNPSEAELVMENDGEGVGLFRSEFLFMDKIQAPDVNEQFEAYKNAAQTLQGRPLIIRTLDAGGDKDIPYLNLPKEENPFLGYRAVRICLNETALYKTQLKAILMASAYGNIRIMVPMVTCVEEIVRVKELIGECKKELDEQGVKYDKDIMVGVMIETPAACVTADELAKEVSFFSIGTNDLTQYVMAADRGNNMVANLYSALNPAVLRCIEHVIKTAKSAGIEVGMCGEAAADPAMIPKLIEWGLDEFSVSPSLILAARKSISQYLNSNK